MQTTALRTYAGCDRYQPTIDCVAWLFNRLGPVMGYTVRVDKWRYSAWLEFNQSSATPNWGNVLATELCEGPHGGPHGAE